MATKPKQKIKQLIKPGSAPSFYPTAWVWSQYRGMMEQTEQERELHRSATQCTVMHAVTKHHTVSLSQNAPGKASYLMPSLFMTLFCCLILIYYLSDRVIKLHNYHLANYENICGAPANVGGDPIEFVKRTGQREDCLMQSRPGGSDPFSTLKALSEAIFNNE